jgi:hypothetical protein
VDLEPALWSAPAESRSERDDDGALAENGMVDDDGARTLRLANSQSGAAPEACQQNPVVISRHFNVVHYQGIKRAEEGTRRV